MIFVIGNFVVALAFMGAETTSFALLGLMLAFTFSDAAIRFDERRQLITQEANAIGTAWLRIDMLPADRQTEMRNLFRQYPDARLETYSNVEDQASNDGGHQVLVDLRRSLG